MDMDTVGTYFRDNPNLGDGNVQSSQMSSPSMLILEITPT